MRVKLLATYVGGEGRVARDTCALWRGRDPAYVGIMPHLKGRMLQPQENRDANSASALDDVVSALRTDS
jgi:hypothetical protein